MFTTETVSQHHRGPVAWDAAAILVAFVEGQARAGAPVGMARGTIAAGLDVIIENRGGSSRPIHIGVGASGLPAAFDGMESADSVDRPASRTFSVDRRACFAREAR